jgi:hypothetical protein
MNTNFTTPEFLINKNSSYLDSFAASIGNTLLLPSAAGDTISNLFQATTGAIATPLSLLTFGASETINDVANTSVMFRDIFKPLSVRVFTILKKKEDSKDLDVYELNLFENNGDFSDIIYKEILKPANERATKRKSSFLKKHITSRGDFLAGLLLVVTRVVDTAFSILGLLDVFFALGKNDNDNSQTIILLNSLPAIIHDISIVARGFFNPSQTFKHKEKLFIVKEKNDLKSYKVYNNYTGKYEEDKASSFTDKLTISIRNLILLPSEIGESINKILKVFTGAIAALISLITFGQFKTINKIADLTSQSHLILMHPFVRIVSIINPKIRLPSRASTFLNYKNPKNTFDKICGENNLDENDKAIYCGTLTYYTTYQIFKSADLAIHNETSFFKKQFVSRALFAVGGLLSIITRVTDLIIGITIGLLAAIFTGARNPKALSFSTRNICTPVGVINDVFGALRGFVNPNQYYVEKDPDKEEEEGEFLDPLL